MKRRKTKPYPGNITRRGEAWLIRLCVAGKYHNFTVRGTRVEAQNFATAKHADLSGDAERIRAGLPGRIRFSELQREFETYYLPSRTAGTRKSYALTLKLMRAYFVDRLQDPAVRDIRKGHCSNFLEWRKQAGDVSAHTIARDRRVMHAFFNYGVEKDFLDANPSALVRAPKGDPRNPPILDAAQLEKLIAAARSEMVRLYLLTLAETGVRAYSEALQLTWDDVDLAGGFLHVRSAPGRRTKTGRSRAVPMSEPLKAALRAHAATYRFASYGGERSPYIFHHVAGIRGATPGAQVQSFRESTSAAIKAAGLPKGFRLHDLRHRRATLWLAEGHNPVHVKEALGHSSIGTTMQYTHLKPEHLLGLVSAPSAKAAAR